MNAGKRRTLLLAALTLPTAARTVSPRPHRQWSGLYPLQAKLSYITALIWSAQRALGGGHLPVRSRQALATLRQSAPTTPPPDWPRRAGYAAFAEAALHDGDRAAGELARQALRGAMDDSADGPRLAGLRPWTDDLFMPALLFNRALPLLPAAEQSPAIDALQASLLALATRLQRPDGLFDHAVGAPVAWGRGNGFASLGLALALSGPLPPQARLLARLREHLQALLPLQGADGLWRQVLDDADSPGELTATAMSVAALQTARRHGWLPTRVVDAAIDRAWLGLHRHVDARGGFSAVCAGTPAGPDLDFYRQRPLLAGPDDRAAAMVLLAAADR